MYLNCITSVVLAQSLRSLAEFNQMFAWARTCIVQTQPPVCDVGLQTVTLLYMLRDSCHFYINSIIYGELWYKHCNWCVYDKEL